MNFYNPYYYMQPTNFIQPKIGLLGKLFGSSGVLLKYDETRNIAAGILNKRCKLPAGLRIYKAGLDREIEPSTARRI